jgi:hypothetical protein
MAARAYAASSAVAVSLTLGASTTLSITLLAAAFLLSFFSSSLVPTTRISDRRLHLIRIALRYLATFFLLAPAIVAFVFVFVWRDASDPNLRFRGRCHLDADVVWSGPGSQCGFQAPTWIAWLAASVVRLILTIILVVRPFLHRHV